MSDQAVLIQRQTAAERNLPTEVRAYIDAYNSGDVDRMLDVLAKDIAFQNISGGAVTDGADGRKAFAQMAEAAVALFFEKEQTVTSAITVADTTVVRIDYRAVPAKDLPNGWRRGETVTLKGRSLFKVKDGKIKLLIDES